MRMTISKLLLLTSITVLSLNFSHAAESSTKFDCTMTDEMKDGSPGDAKDTYANDTAEIFLSCTSSGMKLGDKTKTQWIAIDTNGAAPANYKIAEKELTVDQNLKDSDIYDANFSLTKPNKGWPVGSYKVDLYLNDKLVNSYKFSVEAPAPAPAAAPDAAKS